MAWLWMPVNRSVERVVALIRVGLVSLVVSAYMLLEPLSDGRVYVVIAFALVYSLMVFGLEHGLGLRGRLVPLITVAIDTMLAVALVANTGGHDSPHLPLLYAVAALSAGRFGLIGGLLAASFTSVLYLVAASDGSSGAYEQVVRGAYLIATAAFVGYLVDVVRGFERHEAEEGVRLAARTELDRLKAGFLSTVSHELRTPLTAIRGAASALLRKEASLSTEQRHSLLVMIESRSRHLAALIRDLLDMSSIDRRALRLDPRTVNIAELVEREVEEMGLRTGRRIDILSVNGGPEVTCDPMKVGRALRNLLDNAAKFSPTRTVITVTVQDYQDEVRIDVIDQGVGIASEHLEIIFDRFIQLDQAESRMAEGTGIGLPIARDMMLLHGGVITVSSEPDRGSCFSLVLPKGAFEIRAAGDSAASVRRLPSPL